MIENKTLVKLHPLLSTLFSEIPYQNYDALKEDIRVHGVKVPLIVDKDGFIIDGYNRYRAWKELGKDPQELPYIIRQYSSDDEKIDDAVTINLNRRQLNTAQRALVCLLYILPQIKREAATRVGGKPLSKPPPILEAVNDKGESYDLAGKKGGISKNTLRKFEYVWKNGANVLKEKVLKNEISINAAFNTTRLKKELAIKGSIKLITAISDSQISDIKAKKILELDKGLQDKVLEKEQLEKLTNKQLELLVNNLEKRPNEISPIISNPINMLTEPAEDIQSFETRYGKDYPKTLKDSCPNCGRKYILNYITMELSWEKDEC